MILYIIIFVSLSIIIGFYLKNKLCTNNPKIIISIEGNIGVGKTTLMQIMKKKYSNIADFVEEPVGIWESIVDENGKNLLENYYEDKKRWAYLFQNLVCISRFDILIDILKKSKKQIIVLDRSLKADCEIFAKMLFDTGYMNRVEWFAYQQWSVLCEKYIDSQTNLNIIYLDSNPNTASVRIKKRGRDAEKNISIEYLELINDYHDQWLNNLGPNDRLLILKADSNFENIDDIQNSFMQKIDEFIEKIQTKSQKN
jgi:deoxyadenosine/deoxycytidine kinase